MPEVPHCSCGAVIKPDVTLYGELLLKDAWQGATQSIRKANILIIAGTSLQVNPAPTEKDKWADLVLRWYSGIALGKRFGKQLWIKKNLPTVDLQTPFSTI